VTCKATDDIIIKKKKYFCFKLRSKLVLGTVPVEFEVELEVEFVCLFGTNL